MSNTALLVILGFVVIALLNVVYNYFHIKTLDEGTPEMTEMAGIIRSGASTFLKTEYNTILIVVVVLAVILALFIELTSCITFLLGAFMSSMVCVLGMKSATYANVRTANKARSTLSIGETVKVALCGGSISGLSVQACGMLGLVAVLLIWSIDSDAAGKGIIGGLSCNPSIMRISTYSLGCSIVAMFNRVAGGNYTKAADISSDILAKLRQNMHEDDSRVPNVIGDFIGDNVNDIAGNCSDLLESFVATMSASIMIAVTIYLNNSGISEATFNSTVIFPIVLAACGLLSCIVGLG
ncbi:MAG: sodium/proton-translocating pyrophosphatase [Eubacterium sp.]|nr:sodium/proton-translocating pyrophosphatase [Eubacterium sp.]